MRLIDADFLVSEIKSHNDMTDRGMTWATWQVIELLENCPLPPNDPLTLDELREMDGEPVWVKDFFESHGSWMLVCPDYCENHWCVELYCDYGETWLAYRRRLEEGTT